MKITPLNDQVLLTEDESVKTTNSGIILEQSTSGDTKVYTVQDVGESVTNVTAGDKVIIKLDKVTVVKQMGQLFALVPQESILAVISQ